MEPIPRPEIITSDGDIEVHFSIPPDKIESGTLETCLE